jgi:hypothetical protein
MDVAFDGAFQRKYALPRELPAYVVAKFAKYIVPPSATSDTFPRVFSAAMAVELCADAPPTLKVVLVTSDNVIIGDIATGAITACVSHGPGYTIVSVGSDVCIVGVKSHSGRDDHVLVFAVESDAKTFVDALRAMSRRIEEQVTDSLGRLMDGVKPAVPIAPDATVVPPKQLWSLVNATLPAVADRMSLVKATFAEVDSSTKAVAVAMEMEAKRASTQHERNVVALKKEAAAAEAALAEETAKAADLDSLEARCRELIEDLDLKKREYVALRQSLGAELDHWQAILTQRETDELHAKRRHTKLQSSDRQAMEALEVELVDLKARVRDAGFALDTYRSEAYVAAERERDEALEQLNARTEELEALRRVTSRAQSKRLATNVETTLAANSALSKLLQSSEAHKQQEESKAKRAHELMDATRRVVAQLDDDAKLCAAKNAYDKGRLDLMKQEVAKGDAELQPLRDRVKELENGRRFYLAAKVRNDAAARRRSESERSHSELRSTHTAQTLELLLGNIKMDLRQRLASSSPP